MALIDDEKAALASIFSFVRGVEEGRNRLTPKIVKDIKDLGLVRRGETIPNPLTCKPREQRSFAKGVAKLAQRRLSMNG